MKRRMLVVFSLAAVLIAGTASARAVANPSEDKKNQPKKPLLVREAVKAEDGEARIQIQSQKTNQEQKRLELEQKKQVRQEELEKRRQERQVKMEEKRRMIGEKKCENSKKVFQNKLNMLGNMEKMLDNVYGQMVLRLKRLSETLAGAGADTQKLNQDIATLEGMIVKMRSDFKELLTNMETSQETACYGTREEYRVSFADTREAKNLIRERRAEIREFFTGTIVKELEAIKIQLGLADGDLDDDEEEEKEEVEDVKENESAEEEPVLEEEAGEIIQ